MEKSKLKLPVTEQGTPDWDYMENYMRRVESEHILKYLHLIDKHRYA